MSIVKTQDVKNNPFHWPGGTGVKQEEQLAVATTHFGVKSGLTSGSSSLAIESIANLGKMTKSAPLS